MVEATFRWDTFSHRMEPFESHIVETQSIIAAENIARKYFGTVSGLSREGASIQDVNSYQALVEKIFLILQHIKSADGQIVSYKDYKHNTIYILYFEDTFALEIRSPFEDISDFDEDYDEYGVPSINKVKYSSNYCFSLKIVGVETVLQSILDRLQKEFSVIFNEIKEDNLVSVKFAYPGIRGNVEIQGRKFEALPLDAIQENYRESVVQQVKEMLEIVSGAQHGLVMINGPVGTGKSYLIRAILTELEKQRRRGVVCTPALRFLESAGMLIPVTNISGKTAIILEDVGDLLVNDSSSRYLNETSNLLNFSEGLLSLLADCIVFLTFNHEIEKISEAIVRHGRCLAQIEVPNLLFGHAQRLVNFDLSEKREYSLSEVYEMKRKAVQVVRRKTRATTKNTSSPLGLAR